MALMIGSAAHAAPRPADCKLVVNGKSYIAGVCDFAPEDDGSFQIIGGDYFAKVTMQGKGRAEGYWNEEPGANHAHSSLGILTRKGACWVGKGVEICARKLDGAQFAAALATRPDGFMIMPELPGIVTACVGTNNGQWQPGSALVLRSCRLPGDKVFVRADGTLKLDKHPGVCVGAAAQGTGPARLELLPCERAKQQWDSATSEDGPATIASSDGLCWKVDRAAGDNVELPFAMVAAPCGAESTKFFFEKE